MAAQAIKVEGLANLQRAFGRADRALRADLRDALQEAAAPVRADAQRLAGTEIRRMGAGSPWTRMRIGILGGTVVYVAPVERGVRGRANARRRPKLKPLMLERAMEPALERNRRAVVRRLDHMLDEVARVWGR
jgi:hypothetical protein